MSVVAAALATAVAIAIACLCALVLSATAGAYATIAPPPLYSSAPGLPDGRVYEQVSPADKNGNQAGAGTSEGGEDVTARNHYALAAGDGDSVLFEATGPMGATAAAYNLFFLATKNRSGRGWETRSVLPSAQQPAAQFGGTVGAYPQYLDPSTDLSHVMFEADRGTFAPGMLGECAVSSGVLDEYRGQIYLSGSDPFTAGDWLDRPEIGDPLISCEQGGRSGIPVGGTPNFSTVYFAYPGTLLSEDAERAPHAGTEENVEAWGLYEDREGVLREAGVLPADSPYPGGLDPFGAVPAAGTSAPGVRAGNEVSSAGADPGSRAFFLSPDPASCTQSGGHNDCASDPPELYVREDGTRTVLVSRDALLPEAGGLPAAAPADPEGSAATFSFASPDGSRAFFQSTDDLTQAAKEDSPGPEPKTYDFDVDTGELTYLPAVVGEIVASNTEGTSFAFVRPAAGGAPAELDLWSGPGGGSVTPVAQLPQAGVSQARMSSDGSVLVFLTGSSLSSTFNSGGFQQVYRYDRSAFTLACVSCAPAGVTPTGDAVISQLQAAEIHHTGGQRDPGLAEPRGVSAGGDRIFFDTPDPLVPQDTNTGSAPGFHGQIEPTGDDVYEWENGTVYLISSGKSTNSSYFLDSSENGDDVFFATTEGLVPGDTDGAYDVYDARIPREGDNPPPAAVPCEGSVCQGPPNLPSSLTAPAKATFSSPGNLAGEPTATPAAKPKPKAKTKAVRCKQGYVKKKNKCVKKSKPKKAKKSNRGAK